LCILAHDGFGKRSPGCQFYEHTSSVVPDISLSFESNTTKSWAYLCTKYIYEVGIGDGCHETGQECGSNVSMHGTHSVYLVLIVEIFRGSWFYLAGS